MRRSTMEEPGDLERMVLESYEIHQGYNVAAALSSWALLAGFLVLPGTFTSLAQLEPGSQAARKLQDLTGKVPLFCVSGTLCLTGIVGIGWLWRRHRRNYVWLLVHLFGPGVLSSASGLLTVLVNVYASHDGAWTPPAAAALSIVLVTLAYALTSFAIYRFWFLRKIK